MADSTTPPPRPLEDGELVWQSRLRTLTELCRLRKRNEALELARECYQDPTTPRDFRSACYALLPPSDGNHLRSAREGLENVVAMLDGYPDKARMQEVLKEGLIVLEQAERDAEADKEKAVAGGDRAGTAAAASAINTSFTFPSAAPSAVPAANTEKLKVDSDVPDRHDSKQLKDN